MYSPPTTAATYSSSRKGANKIFEPTCHHSGSHIRFLILLFPTEQVAIASPLNRLKPEQPGNERQLRVRPKLTDLSIGRPTTSGTPLTALDGKTSQKGSG